MRMDLIGKPDRRALLAGTAGVFLAASHAARAATARVRDLGAAAGPVTITAIDSFDIQLPRTQGARTFVPTYRNMTAGRSNFVKISTNEGTTGYSFLGAAANEVARARALLVGQDLFAIERHLKNGRLDWPSIEEAMWDTIGRIAGQPLCRLLGGASLDTMPVYFTYVWPVPEDQVPPEAQADQARLARQAGFKAMKIQMMRTDYRGDVEATRQMIAAG